MSAGAAVPIEHGRRDRDTVALTFDADVSRHLPRSRAAARAGPHREILAFLKDRRVPATLFLTGLWVELHPSDAREIGHEPLLEVGNHSYSHRAFGAPCFGLPVLGSDREKREEVLRGARVIAAATGRTPRYFRFPGGCYAPRDVELVRALGAEPVQWDVLSGDSFDFDPKSVARRIVSGIRPGSIVVMHLSEPQQAVVGAVLTIVLPDLRARGLIPVTLSDLLGGPNHQQQVRGHREQLPIPGELDGVCARMITARPSAD